MAASDILVRPIRADERADWEPLWKGYPTFHLKNNPLVLLAFRL
jgi:hypothetical protein